MKTVEKNLWTMRDKSALSKLPTKEFNSRTRIVQGFIHKHFCVYHRTNAGYDRVIRRYPRHHYYYQGI